MANRHLSRSIILQTLYEWDFKEKPDQEIGEILSRNVEEFGPGLDDTPFMEGILESVIKNKNIIDEIITKAAPQWPLEKINAVDRNILRMSLSELIFGDRNEVPPKVAINEAIELGKTFGGESSGRFVNGVLGAVYKELGEPGKDDAPKRNKNEDIDIESLPVEKKAGAIVYAKQEDKYYLAFVHDVFGYWTLSKGSIEQGEDAEAGAIRELKEEIGIDITIKEKLGESEYIASHPTQGKIRKQVTFFLAEAPYGDLTLESSGGLDDAKWFSFEEIPNLKMYDDVTKLVGKAIEIITK
jgi:N utilization substance protein B